jgi:hypothetical protein
MSTLRVNTLQNVAGTGDPSINGAAKAWVNFNGTGTVAIRAAFNVSSITDNGTGDYTVNFTTAMVDTNYSAVSVPSNNVVTGSICTTFIAQTYSTTQARLQTQLTITGGMQDPIIVSVAVFR